MDIYYSVRFFFLVLWYWLMCKYDRLFQNNKSGRKIANLENSQGIFGWVNPRTIKKIFFNF